MVCKFLMEGIPGECWSGDVVDYKSLYKKAKGNKGRGGGAPMPSRAMHASQQCTDAAASTIAMSARGHGGGQPLQLGTHDIMPSDYGANGVNERQLDSVSDDFNFEGALYNLESLPPLDFSAADFERLQNVPPPKPIWPAMQPSSPPHPGASSPIPSPEDSLPCPSAGLSVSEDSCIRQSGWQLPLRDDVTAGAESAPPGNQALSLADSRASLVPQVGEEKPQVSNDLPEALATEHPSGPNTPCRSESSEDWMSACSASICEEVTMEEAQAAEQVVHGDEGGLSIGISRCPCDDAPSAPGSCHWDVACGGSSVPFSCSNGEGVLQAMSPPVNAAASEVDQCPSSLKCTMDSIDPGIMPSKCSCDDVSLAGGTETLSPFIHSNNCGCKTPGAGEDCVHQEGLWCPNSPQNTAEYADPTSFSQEQVSSPEEGSSVPSQTCTEVSFSGNGQPVDACPMHGPCATESMPAGGVDQLNGLETAPWKAGTSTEALITMYNTPRKAVDYRDSHSADSHSGHENTVSCAEHGFLRSASSSGEWTTIPLDVDVQPAVHRVDGSDVDMQWLTPLAHGEDGIGLVASFQGTTGHNELLGLRNSTSLYDGNVLASMRTPACMEFENHGNLDLDESRATTTRSGAMSCERGSGWAAKSPSHQSLCAWTRGRDCESLKVADAHVLGGRVHEVEDRACPVICAESLEDGAVRCCHKQQPSTNDMYDPLAELAAAYQ
eukprot:evm.model.scf_3.11 EVM.evm.TU.scf_3.11   scf_3:208689-212866(-)